MEDEMEILSPDKEVGKRLFMVITTYLKNGGSTAQENRK